MSGSIIFTCTIVLSLFYIFWVDASDFITDPIVHRLKKDLLKLNEPKVLELEFRSGPWSKSIDKSRIILCVRDPKTQEYYDYNFLMKVALHELAHCINPKISFSEEKHHDDDWRKIFNRLIKKAADVGIYNPNQKEIANYCKI